MGVSWRQAGFGALVVAAVLLPLRPAEHPVAAPITNSARDRLDSLNFRRSRASNLWSALDARDLAIQLASSHPASPGRPTYVLGGQLARGSTTILDSLISEVWEAMPDGTPGVGTTVLVFDERDYIGNGYSGSVMVPTADGMQCFAVLGGYVSGRGNLTVYGSTLQYALAPCALLSAFGRPGKGLGTWLDRTRYLSAQSTSWLVTRRDPFAESPPWAYWYARGPRFRTSDLLSMMEPIGLFDVVASMAPPYSLGVTGLRCLAGSAPDCLEGVLHPASPSVESHRYPRDMTVSRWETEPDSVNIGSVRPPSADFLSGMITEFGRERFGKFWRSDLPMERAFQDAFGEPLAAWTLRWAQKKWHVHSVADLSGRELKLGVTSHWIDLVSLLVWTGVGLAITAWVAKRRTA